MDPRASSFSNNCRGDILVVSSCSENSSQNQSKANLNFATESLSNRTTLGDGKAKNPHPLFELLFDQDH